MSGTAPAPLHCVPFKSMLHSYINTLCGETQLCLALVFCVGPRRSVPGPGAASCSRTILAQHCMVCWKAPRSVSGPGALCRAQLCVGPRRSLCGAPALCRAPALCVGPRCCVTLNLARCAELHVCLIAIQVSEPLDRQPLRSPCLMEKGKRTDVHGL